jgi:hypothetical protein
MPRPQLPQLQLPQPPSPSLPRQMTQNSSTRGITPSSSSLTSPSNLSSRPPWAGDPSRVSTTLHSHSHSTNRSQPRVSLPSTETNGHTDSYTALPPSITERQRSANGPQPQSRSQSQSQSQTPTRSKLPTRAITPQRKQHRYCEPCGITKPPRTHHCRTCGKVRYRFALFLGWDKRLMGKAVVWYCSVC